ncbi:MAG TPA: hypothetical protein VG499_12115, partial [Actinomycetota bacterium]|nr:hypothetical protein [Actinomycetota bacterium]
LKKSIPRSNEPIEAAGRTPSEPATSRIDSRPGGRAAHARPAFRPGLRGRLPARGLINGSSDLNILNINQPDNALHLASAALGLYFGLAGRRHAVAPTA